MSYTYYIEYYEINSTKNCHNCYRSNSNKENLDPRASVHLIQRQFNNRCELDYIQAEHEYRCQYCYCSLVYLTNVYFDR